MAEALVAVALVAIVAVGVSTYVVDSKKQNAKTESATDCRAVAQSITSDFSNNSSAIVINSFGVPPAPGQINYLAKNATTNLYGNYQNISNDVTRVLQMYNFDPTFCVGLGKLLTVAMLKTPSLNLKANNAGMRTYLNITPVSTMNTAVSFCGSVGNALNLGPLSIANTNTSNALKITVTSQVMEGAVSTAQCSAESYLNYSADNQAPSITAPVPIVVDYVTNTFTGVIQSSEPGSLFECNSGAGYSPCNGFAAGFSAPLTVSIINPGGGNSNLQATISGSFNCPATINLDIRAVDTGSNVSADLIPVTAISCP